jgi:superfamily I DNA/RNA helicase
MVAQLETRRKAWSKKNALAREPQWSEYQQAIFYWVEHGEGNLQIGACAGSGKSTVIAAIVSRLPNDAKIQILAFNKHIVEAMKSSHSDGTPKLPTRVGVTTAHSMGNALLARCFEGVAQVDNGKYRRIAKPFVAAMDTGNATKTAAGLMRRQWMKFALDLVRGCHSTLCNPSPETLRKLIAYYGIEVPPGGEPLIRKIAEILDAGEDMARRQQIIDFGDMLWLPYKWELYPTAKDWLLIDETQDANRAQLHLYEKCGRHGRVIAVGDEDQAIQGFAFASPKMWGEIKTRFNATTLPLSVCYRCPTSHLDLARYFVPAIEPSPTAKTGDVTVLHPAMVPGVVELGDLVLCRFTAPLITLCFDLIVRGIPAKVRGRDIGANLARLADIGEANWAKFAAVITQIMGSEIAKFREEEKGDRADSTQDNLDCLLAIYSHFGKKCDSLDKFLSKIESLFSDSASPVTLSTIHRSKGDEADNVFILASNSLPYRRDGMQDWQAKQEDNLTYVALTRAKQSLVLVPMDRDERKTQILTSDPFGGMDVTTVLFTPKTQIKPYAVGDKFSWFGNPGYEITSVIPAGESYEYEAKYTGKEYHFKADTYRHSLMQINSRLEIE